MSGAMLGDAVPNGIELTSNAFMLIHGWTAGPLLLEFVAHCRQHLHRRPMRLEELAAATGAKEGPLAIVMRTCCILDYVTVDSKTHQYSLVRGMELDELDAYLRPSASTSRAIRGLYTDVTPPFLVPSDDVTACLAVWAEHRPSWKNSRSKGLGLLLDGIVLAPLLTSITYFARWNEDGREYATMNVMDRVDFSKVDPVSMVALGDIFEELGVGTMNAKGVITMSSKGTTALQRCYSYYVPMSYYPMLSNFSIILFEDPGWGFADTDQDAAETEEHVDRMLNVIGSGAQHKTLFKDLMGHISNVFGGDDFASQPQFVIDTGCGDGSLLKHVYEHVKLHTPRGEALDEYPLTMVGVDFSEESRVITAVTLSKHNIPKLVIAGDIGKPGSIMKSLQSKKVDLSKSLHVRSFLDHDRPYIPAAKMPTEESAVAVYAKAQMADFVHLDKHGNPIPAVALFASLVEHFGRWSAALEGSFGLCMLEVMMLDASTTRTFINDAVSFHFDIVQCLSRQYMVSANVFAMAAAMGGLLPKNFDRVETYPQRGPYCRMLNQHLVKRPFTVRFAELADLPALEELEKLAWGADSHLGATREVLQRRLETSPTTNLACEMSGRVVAVLYMQLIDSTDAVYTEKFQEISDAHSPTGRIVQLIAILTHPDVRAMNLANELKAFALHLARLDQKVDCVVGVTRCREFKQYNGTMEAYVEDHIAGTVTDAGLAFHTAAGARLIRLVPGFRPEDVDNDGTGVLIQYDVNALQQKEVETAREMFVTMPALDIITTIMRDLGYALSPDDLTRGFFDFGMDSLELVRIRNKLSDSYGQEFSATLLLDFPTVQDLAVYLDRGHGVGADKSSKKSSHGGSIIEAPEKTGWDAIGAGELLAILEKCKTQYELVHFQKMFRDTSEKCYPDMLKYMMTIEPVLNEVEGPILMEYGLINETSPDSVQRCREEMTERMAKHWRQDTKINEVGRAVIRLTLQHQYWM